jgi:3-hydroxyacyl-CoA dehydrogenase
MADSLMNGLVRLERQGEIALVTIDNPPINASAQPVRTALIEAIDTIAKDDAISGALIACAGKTFVAGADINEFGAAPKSPALRDVCEALESLRKPVVAVLHGTALGGGFELALACHYRVIDPQGSVGLPEVTLGLIPGAGGTQRLPRLAGIATALDLIVSGRRVGAEEALAAGIVDAVTSGDRLAFAAAFLRMHLDRPPPRLSKRAAPYPDAKTFAEARAAAQKRQAGQIAPLRAIDAIEAATARPFAEGMAFEADAFAELRASPQARALRHMFFAERAAAKVPQIEGVSPRPVAFVGVIGGGTMGAGIAAATLMAGLDVHMIERDDATAAAGHDRVKRIVDEALARRKLTPTDHRAILDERFVAGTDLAALRKADLVIEAIVEDLGLKQALFADLDRTLHAGAVLATNTSYLDVARIAAETARGSDIIGLHFFSPAHIMKLLEVVVPDGASPTAIATGFAFGRALGKLCVRAGNSEGFIGNRILSAYRHAAEYILEDGASPAEIDGAFKGFGFPMGLFEMQDLAGLDISWANRRRLAPTRNPQARYVRIGDRLCDLGHFGRKTGRGYYLYEGGAPAPNPAADAIIAEERRAKGITPRPFTQDEITGRILAAMINEAARVLGEGVALRAGDIDVVMVNGYGFPRWRGGPLHFAGERGLRTILADIELFGRDDPLFWQPAALLREYAAAGRRFDEV